MLRIKLVSNVLCTLVIFSLFSCKNNQGMAQTKHVLPSNVAPGHCRIIGKIVEIQAVQVSKNPTRPCEKQPCKAKVQVTKILGYGSGFHSILSLNSYITINFAFTLGPTKNLFPKLNQALPGLKQGESFQGDISGADGGGEMGAGSKTFTIYTYHKQ